nr:putative reverse transcriptase domain-containing protein [Tanacetum cinerariifolium]
MTSSSEGAGYQTEHEHNLPPRDRWSDYHKSIKCVPFEALYRRKCRSLVIWIEIGESQLIGPEIMQETTEKIFQIKERLKTARSRQKSHADKRRKPLEFKVRDRVLLKVAYRLKLPQELSYIHDTFHVSNLKKCLAESDAQLPLEEIKFDENLRFVEEPIEIVERDVASKCPISSAHILLIAVFLEETKILSILLEITPNPVTRAIVTPLRSPMGTMWCLCDSTSSSWCKTNAHSTDLGVMESHVDTLMKDAISIMGKSENIFGILSKMMHHLPPEPSRQEAFKDLVMNFILDQEEKVCQLKEYMCIIGSDFMQLSSEVVEKLKIEIRVEKNRFTKIKKITSCPSLDISLGGERGPEPPIKPHSPDSFRIKPCIDDPKKHYGFKPCLLGQSKSLGVDFLNMEMIEND